MKIKRVCNQMKILLTTHYEGRTAGNVTCRVTLDRLQQNGSVPPVPASGLSVDDRTKFEKESRSTGGGSKKGELSLQVPREVEDEADARWFPVYLVEALGIEDTPEVSLPADAQSAVKASANVLAVHELALGDVTLPNGSLTVPFVAYRDQLRRGNATGLDTIGELPKATGDGVLYEYFAVDIDEPNGAQARQRLTRWPKDRSGWVKPFDQTPHELVSDGQAIYWRRQRDVVTGSALSFVNDGFDWLTYETILNKEKFRKTNQPLEYGLYTLPSSDLIVFLRSRLGPEQRECLASAFFPDQRSADVEAASQSLWRWKNPGYTTARAAMNAPQRLQLSRNEGAIHHAERRVVLPYNYYDNHGRSCAVGTRRDPQETPRARQLTKHWSFWKTASRSSVVRLERVKGQAEAWSGVEATADWSEWPFWKGVEKREHTQLATEASAGNAFRTADLGSSHVSLKTGVCYVGRQDQSAQKTKDPKDYIDSNWVIACLRSDYIVETEAAVGGGDDRLVVLTELLSITEKEERDMTHMASLLAGQVFKVRDGVQVRDLSRMRSDRVYVFPGSVPYLGEDYKTLTTAYAAATSADWRVFWRAHWAAALGRTKALFLLRYGLQHLNPNPQNYLIELRKSSDGGVVGPARIVIRDLQDASLHREVQWALFGPENDPVPTTTDPDAARTALGGAFKARADSNETDRPIARILQYEFQDIDKDGFDADDFQETGTTPEAFRGPGTKLGWASFSAGVAFTKDDWLRELQTEAGSAGRMDQIINLLADWGLAHAIAWTRCIECELGHEFREIDWRKLPSLELKAPASEEAVVADVVHTFLRDAGGAILRKYRTDRWVAPAPRETLKVYTEVANRPAPWSVIEFQTPTSTWLRPTDDSGEIPLFQPLPSETAFTRLIWCGRYERTGEVSWTRREQWERVPLVRTGLTLRPRT